MEPAIPKIKKILFTTDLSKQTHHAFNYAMGLAIQYGAGLTILFVMEDTPQVKSQDFEDFLGKIAGPRCANPMSRRSGSC